MLQRLAVSWGEQSVLSSVSAGIKSLGKLILPSLSPYPSTSAFSISAKRHQISNLQQ